LLSQRSQDSRPFHQSHVLSKCFHSSQKKRVLLM
jgi:hypothetical protein